MKKIFSRRLCSALAATALAAGVGLAGASSASAATGYITVTQLNADGTVLGVQALQFVANGGCFALPVVPGQQLTNIINLTTREIRVHSAANCAGSSTAVPALIGVYTFGGAPLSVTVPPGL